MSEAAVQTAEPLLLVGERRRAALERALSSCVQSWRQRWSLATESLQVCIGAAEAAGTRNVQCNGLVLRGSSARLGKLFVLRAPPELMPALLGVAGAPTEHGVAEAAHSIARQLQQEIIHSLGDALLKAAQVADPVVELAPASQATNGADKRHTSWLSAAICFAKAKICLSLSARFVELLAAPQPLAQSASAPARRRAAIAEAHVRVEAVLGQVEVALQDLIELGAGDVLVLDQPLSGGGYLAMPDGTRVTGILLGKAGAARAVSVSNHPMG
jgi:flagellar motor switch/type III secretory pathway protein FliN